MTDPAALRPDWTARLGGSWKNADVPWQGWSCEDILTAARDADGRLTETCEMCRQKHGRRIHRAFLMTHPDYGTLRFGINCAWRMEMGEQLGRGGGGGHTYELEVEKRLAAGFTVRAGEGWKLQAARVCLPDDTYVWDLLFRMEEGWVRVGRAGTRAEVLQLAQACDTAALTDRFLGEWLARKALAAAQKQFALENELFQQWLRDGIVLAAGEDDGPWRLVAKWVSNPDGKPVDWLVDYHWNDRCVRLQRKTPIRTLKDMCNAEIQRQRQRFDVDALWPIDEYLAQIPGARQTITALCELEAEAILTELPQAVIEPDRWISTSQRGKFFPLPWAGSVIFASPTPWDRTLWSLAARLPGEGKPMPYGTKVRGFEDLITQCGGYLQRKIAAGARIWSELSEQQRQVLKVAAMEQAAQRQAAKAQPDHE
jgi:hypothetical protein